jgi:HAMP domain-containing protein
MLMLELATGQIEASMTDSNRSVDVLTQSFTSMAVYLQTITRALETLPEHNDTGLDKAEVLQVAQNVNQMVQQAIIAFQFYDKLSQRMTHVCHSLSDLSGLVADQGRIFNPSEWVQLQGKIRSKYTTADELQMFEAVMNGASVQEALEHFVHEMKDNDIEFF